jgi:hypothetical protein
MDNVIRYWLNWTQGDPHWTSEIILGRPWAPDWNLKTSPVTESSNQRPVLLTVPHAFSYRDEPGHPRDFSAPAAADELEAALRSRGVENITRLDGNKDRSYEKDLNRFPVDPLGPVEKWIRRNPHGILLDVHSFPPDFNWQNPTVRSGIRRAGTPLVILMPVENREFALKFDEDATQLQGSEVNKLINLGLQRSVLLEFSESPEVEWPIDEIVEVVMDEV